MIRVRTPLRLPFAGGLTDVKAYAQRFGGVTVSATIGLGVEVELCSSRSGRFEIVDAEGHEAVDRLDDIRNDLVREVLRAVDPAHQPVRVVVRLEVEGKSGLGASGAIAVALLQAAWTARGVRPTAAELGREAARIEVEVLAGNSGYHDPHVCARGGILRLDYRGAEVEATGIELPQRFLSEFEASLLLFATGVRAGTRESLSRLSGRLDDALDVMHEIKALAKETEQALTRGDLHGIARCIAEQQHLKQRLPGNFNDPLVTEVHSLLAPLGASVQFPGGKVGAYMFVCCPDAQQPQVRAALDRFAELPLSFSMEGSRVVE
ncbi:MAG TPA: hypothetical protein VF168_08005 [Trueperaceae bacterium]